MTTPTLINLPPPPSDPVTPSDMGPGTPNSGLSALSTTAIKDGHQGAPFPHARHTHQSSSASTSSTTTLDAERADRISRLAGLERVATARAGGHYSSSANANANANANTGAGANATSTPQTHTPGAAASYGFFDSPATLKERSTVGSASATGSLGGNTYTSTWASGSEAYEDKMSEDPDPMDRDHEHEHEHDDAISSISNVSDEGNASLVGFGEGASSTISGPTSRPPPGLNRMSSGGGGARPTSMSSNVSRSNPLASYLQQQQQQQQQNPSQLYQQQQAHQSYAGDNRMSPSPAGSNTPEPMEDARMVDGMTFDRDVVDTTARTPRLASPFDRGEGGGGGGGGGFGTPGHE
ncbi:unnamed protein product [Penicillium pancosmium]